MALIVIAIGVAVTMKDQNERESVANEIASRPTRERNLAVFDAATALLRTHYYDSKIFTTAEWRKLEAEWRDKAAVSESPLLYLDVLDGLAHEFPESHVGFDPPPQRDQADPASAPATHVEYERASWGAGFDAPEIRRAQGRPQVIDDVLRGSPAERAGVTPGWILVKHHTEANPDRALYIGEFLELAPDASRGAETTGRWVPHETVKLEFELEMLPAPPDFETRQLPGGITYLRFDFFDSPELVEKVLTAIEDAATTGLILDLRRNPGGRQLHLQRVAGALLGKESVLGTTRTANSTTPMASLRFADHFRGPLVALIGPSTASAAEIAAAAIQDHKRGKLIGRTTNGSVVLAQWFDLPDGGKMMIPVSDFVRSDGRRIEGAGVEPDIWILPTLDDVRAGRDPVLERALQEIRINTATPLQSRGP